jgi:tetratricopeptide (TPR) repeat protein
VKRTAFYLITLSLVAAPLGARTVELTLHPAKASESARQYRLLPKAEQLTDADAVPLYEKARQSLPNDLQMDEIDQWLNTPPDKLPRKQVQSILEQLKPALELLEQATRCKQCDWPYLDDDALSENLRKYRRILFLLALKVRLQIAQGQYDEAIGTMQTGFAMAKHLGADASVVRGLVGIGVAAYICRQIEQFIQKPDAPNLYEALRRLPHPFIDLTEQVEWEDPDIKERIHLLMKRLDRHVAALQCIEAMRLYMAAHDGAFPSRLSDVTLVTVPDDPATRKPFVYNRTGSKAVLETPATKGARIRDAMRYELNLKE